jgi:hypothetical protein
MSRREKLLHPATLISLIALFVALGGVGYAAATIGTKQIKNRAVTNKKLAPNSVSTSKIRPGAVRNGDLANNSVSSAKIQPGSIVSADLGAGSILNGNLANGAVTGAKIANETIGTVKLQNGSVASDKIGTGAVIASKLAANSVTTAAIAPGAVGAAQIAPGQVVRGNGQLTSAATFVANGTVDSALLSFPGLGVLQADCSGEDPVFDFLNNSGATIESIYYWGVAQAAGAVSPDPADLPLANGAALTLESTPDGFVGATWLVSLGTGASLRQASIQVAGTPATGGCNVSAQATYSSP